MAQETDGKTRSDVSEQWPLESWTRSSTYLESIHGHLTPHYIFCPPRMPRQGRRGSESIFHTDRTSNKTFVSVAVHMLTFVLVKSGFPDGARKTTALDFQHGSLSLEVSVTFKSTQINSANYCTDYSGKVSHAVSREESVSLLQESWEFRGQRWRCSLTSCCSLVDV